MPDLVPQGNELERVHKELERWRGKAFLLTPYARTHFDSIKNGYRPEFRVTYISPDENDKQVYKLDGQSNKLVLTKIGLQLLDHLADIKWVRIWNALDPKVDPIDKWYCKIGAEGKVQDLDGAYRNSICTVTLDLREGSSTTEKMLKVSPDGKQLARARLNIVSQTETLAKNKVRRELLGLQGTYTPKELTEKPFVILKLTPCIDMNDPLVRKLTIMQQFNISSDMYDDAIRDLPAIPAPPETTLITAAPQWAEAAPPETQQGWTTPGPLVDQGKGEVVIADSLKALIDKVKDLYRRKVRGGRSASKPPLEDLNINELLELEKFLQSKPDLT